MLVREERLRKRRQQEPRRSRTRDTSSLLESCRVFEFSTNENRTSKYQCSVLLKYCCEKNLRFIHIRLYSNRKTYVEAGLQINFQTSNALSNLFSSIELIVFPSICFQNFLKEVHELYRNRVGAYFIISLRNTFIFISCFFF